MYIFPKKKSSQFNEILSSDTKDVQSVNNLMPVSFNVPDEMMWAVSEGFPFLVTIWKDIAYATAVQDLRDFDTHIIKSFRTILPDMLQDRNWKKRHLLHTHRGIFTTITAKSVIANFEVSNCTWVLFSLSNADSWHHRLSDEEFGRNNHTNTSWMGSGNQKNSL
jgi:hypothetical protein